MCEAEEYAKEELGTEIAEALKHRLADLDVANSVNDLIAGYPRRDQGSDHFLVNLADDYCLEFNANHLKNPLNKTGSIDWNKVSRVKIVDIGRCHG